MLKCSNNTIVARDVLVKSRTKALTFNTMRHKLETIPWEIF